MSVQSEFFEALLAELKARGLSDEVASENVSKFKSQLSERAENDEYIDDALSKIPPASIAENIYNMIRAEDDEDAGAKSEVVVIDTENDTIETTIKEGKDAMSPLADEQSEDMSDVKVDDENEPDEAVEKEVSAPDEVDEVTEEVTDEAAEEVTENTEEEATEGSAEEADTESSEGESGEEEYFFSDEGDPFTAFSEQNEAESSQKVSENTNDEQSAEESADEQEDDVSVYSPTNKRRINDSKKHVPTDKIGEKKPARLSSESLDLFSEEDESKTSWLFIVMAVFLIPLFFVLGSVAFVAVLGLWIGLAVVIALLLVALAAIVVAGTAYAVLGLIFGIIEAFSGNAAAALFEVGLALCVGGVVMFVGIWVYNFAIRFIPFVIKKLGVLLVLIFKLFKKALVKLKALCRKI